MRRWVRYLARIELGLELAGYGLILELFHRLRPGLEVGCGSAPSQLSDDLLFVVSDHRLSVLVPILVAAIELRVAFRPWVKRSVRLAAALAFAAMLASYVILIESFV